MASQAVELPHSDELERAVLASVLVEPISMAAVEVYVGAGDFHKTAHQLIFGAMEELAGEHSPIDLRTVQERLEAGGALAKVGGVAYLASLELDLPDTGRVDHYAQELRKLSTARQVIRVCEAVASRLGTERDPEVVRDELLAAQRLLDDSSVQVSGGPFSTRIEAAGARLRSIKAGDRQAGLRTGFRLLDAELVGFGHRELVVVAGYAGAGKTSLTEQLMHNWLLAGERVLVVHLEMGQEQTEDRVFGRQMKRPPKDLRSGRFAEMELDRALEALAQAEWTERLVELHPRSAEISEVCAQARAAHRQRPCSVLVVDHLMELEFARARGDRRREVSEAVKAMKGLARELDVPVVVPAQISREGGRRAEEGQRPRLWHLGESVEVERRADTILMMWAPDDESNKRHLCIEKARQGERGFAVVLEMNLLSREYKEIQPVGGSAPVAPAPWETSE